MIRCCAFLAVVLAFLPGSGYAVGSDLGQMADVGWQTEEGRGASDARNASGEIIVKVRPELRERLASRHRGEGATFGIPALDAIGERYRVRSVAPLLRHPDPDSLALRHGCDLQYLVRFDHREDVLEVAQEYERLAEVAYAEPNLLLPVTVTPDDTLYPFQWHLAKIGAPFAWSKFKGDTTVLIGVLDDGCEWHHPDMEPNLWINEAEDINGNGRFDTFPPPDGDLDGIDQDGNGYADDVIGWNMTYGKPDPAPYRPQDDHGTHCWGIANAATDNRIGVAGVAWNCRSFAFCCGGGGFIFINAAIEAMYYLVPRGGRVISMSFGGYNTNQALADACAYAWDAGLVLVGGAGNDGQNRPFYPADYPNVISVAATGPDDRKTSWSNYGEWIEIAAPGSGILATVTNHGYGSKDGTSMATPVVSGALAWLLSAYPELTNAEACSLLFAACDSIPDEFYRNGMMGAGRVSIGRIVLPRFYTDLVLTEVRVNDEAGNGNGRLDPGETAAIIVTYRNSEGWQDATGVSATLSCTHPGVTLLKPDAGFPDIPAGASGDCSQDSFVVRVDSMPPQKLHFSITVTAEPEPAYPDTAFELVCGSARVLLVDDDAGRDFERWYSAALDSNGILYHTHDVNALGPPPADTLKSYPVVVWYTGDDSLTTLSADERAALAAFLDNGGDLLISGKNIAQNISSEPFLADYLRAEFVDPSTAKPYIVGVSEDPITRGDTIVAGGGGGQNNGISLDGIRPTNGGVGAARFRDYADTTVHAIVRYSGDYSLVYFSIPFEAINHSATRYVQKWTLIARIFRWFGEGVPGVEEPRNPIPDKRPYVLRVAPNPSAGRVRVGFVSPVRGGVELRAYAPDGRLVRTRAGTASLGEVVESDLDLTGLGAGVYLLQLVTEEGVFSQKAVVLR